MTRPAPPLRDEHGFTLVEVLVAMALLLGGVVAALTLINASNAATVTTKAREQGVSLQRELVEAARSLSYDKLAQGTVADQIRATPGLADDQPTTPGWQILRRGVVYTVAVGSCSVDDPSDGYGVVATNDPGFCPAGGGTTAAQCRDLLGTTGSIQGTAAAGTATVAVGDCGIDLDLDGTVDRLSYAQLQGLFDICTLGLCPATRPDTYPDDYKRVVTLVRWDRGTGSRYALQSTTVPNPGSSAAPQVTALTQTTTTATSLSFAATTSRLPATVAWLVDRTAKGSATGADTGPWTFTWNVGTVSAGAAPNTGEVLDGTYVVSAEADDAFGASGQTKAVTVSLNRRIPYRPSDFIAGRNSGGSAAGASGVVDFDWSPNRESDVAGYRVYRVGSGTPVCSTGTATATECEATGEPLTASDYYVVALDHLAAVLREGDHTANVTVSSPAPVAPTAPGSLTATASGSSVALSWTPSVGAVDFYRIYRDGVAFANRYDRTGTATELTYTDTRIGSGGHVYRVVAVSGAAESSFSGAVTG